MKNILYYKQADLLIRILPHVAEEPDFALHGGTAINFFIRSLPRLSVDIDLTYLPVESREETLRRLGEKLGIIAQKIRKTISGGIDA
jgi:hypothetical protein